MRHGAREAAKSGTPLLAHGAFLRLALRGARISAQKIVQIKKHGRAFRGIRHQIPEFAQRMRLNHIAFVRCQVIAVFAFARKHIEMVEPEIVHDLLQLSLAVDGASHFGHRQLFDNTGGPLAVVGDGPGHGVGINAQCAALSCTGSGGVAGGLLHR